MRNEMYNPRLFGIWHKWISNISKELGQVLTPRESLINPQGVNTVMEYGGNQQNGQHDILSPNSRFLLKLFRRYYASYTPIMPERHNRKEFGFIPFEGTMRRHMAFGNQAELKSFVASKVPAHSYYSTAYYRNPAAPTMDQKGWMGAELIFDLDADHLANADKMTYDEMLVQIRSEMISLVDDYIMGDLGFSEDQVHISFSGGRGYHAHVRTPDIYTLGTNERRELVDFMTCTGLDLDWVFPKRSDPIGSVSMGNGLVKPKMHNYRLIPSKDETGWKGRMRNSLENITSQIMTEAPKDFKKRYPSVKSGNESIEKLADHLSRCHEEMFTKNTMGDLEPWEQEILMKCLEDSKPLYAREVDKPVTPDIKRLIRLPGSLHGKTGLRVHPITRDELTDYNPLMRAVPEVYTDDPVKVTMRKDMDLRMLDLREHLSGETEVPEFAAAFLIGRKYADFGWASERRERLF